MWESPVRCTGDGTSIAMEAAVDGSKRLTAGLSWSAAHYIGPWFAVRRG